MGSKVCGVVSRHPRLVDMGIACSGVLARMEQDQTCQVVPCGCAQHVSCVLHFAFAKIYLCTLPCGFGSVLLWNEYFVHYALESIF